jgi:large subunit ribosomal protein L29
LNLKDERELLQKLKFSHAVSPIENPGKIKASRKLVASYMTEINRRRHQKAEQA